MLYPMPGIGEIKKNETLPLRNAKADKGDIHTNSNNDINIANYNDS